MAQAIFVITLNINHKRDTNIILVPGFFLEDNLEFLVSHFPHSSLDLAALGCVHAAEVEDQADEKVSSHYIPAHVFYKFG